MGCIYTSTDSGVTWATRIPVTGITFYARLSVTSDAYFSKASGGTTATVTGTVTFSSGKAVLAAGATIQYPVDGYLDAGQRGCIRFKYYVNYSEPPTYNVIIFRMYSGSGNMIELLHSSPSTNIYLYVRDIYGNELNGNGNMGSYSFSYTIGSEIDIEINWDTTVPFYYFYSQGARFYASGGSIVTGVRGPPTSFYIGDASNLDSFSIAKLGVFNTPQHTASSFTYSANKYWSTLASSSNGSDLMAGINAGQVLTSSDSGITWIPILRTVYPITGVSISSDGQKKYACYTSNGKVIAYQISPNSEGITTTSSQSIVLSQYDYYSFMSGQYQWIMG